LSVFNTDVGFDSNYLPKIANYLVGSNRKSELPIRVNPDSVRNPSVEPFARREQDVFRWRDPGCEPSQTPLPTAMHAIPNVPQREVI
jgi:hypothetical protein